MILDEMIVDICHAEVRMMERVDRVCAVGGMIVVPEKNDDQIIAGIFIVVIG